LRGGSLARFTGLVYASALRQMNGDSHAAADVAQAVFIVALEKQRGGKLPGDERLAGWLLKVTGFCVKKAKRTAVRRSFHERRAMRSETMARESSTDEAAKVLDEALLKLGEVDREVVVRRYLHGEPIGAVASAVRLTENAASQRIGRALEKLRKILARRGVITPAAMLTTLMLAERAKAAPAAVAGTSAAAISIAKGATMAMKIAAFKTVAAWVVVAGMIGVAAIVVAQRHDEPKMIMAVNHEAKVTGLAQIARWEVLLNQAGAAEVKKAGTPLATSSKVYEGMTANGAALRQAVKEAMKRGEAVRTKYGLEVAREFERADNLKFFWSQLLSHDEDAAANVMGHMSDSQETYQRVKTDRVEVSVNYPLMDFGLREKPSVVIATQQDKQAIVFSREMAAGDAVAFVGKYVAESGNVYYHLIVWEVFKAQREQMDIVTNQYDAGWWCGHGPEALRQRADTSRLWNASAVREVSAVAADFEKKLEDGKVVQLLALCQPSRWPGCWWDAQGNPVRMDSFSAYRWAYATVSMYGDSPEGLVAMVGVKGEQEEWYLQSPKMSMLPRGGPLPDGRMPPEVYAGAFKSETTIDETWPLQVGVMVGQWKQIGSLYENQSTTAGDVEYRVGGARGFTTYFSVKFWRKGNLANEDQLVAATVDGKTVEIYGVHTLAYGPKPADGEREEMLDFYKMAANEVKEFRIYQRKREWVEFEGFAREPKVLPQGEVRAEEIVQAEMEAKRRADQKRLAALEAKRAEWRAVGADAKTEMGALRMLVDAIQKGDEKGVQAMLMSKNPRVEEKLGTLANVLVEMERIRITAVARYGELTVADQLEDIRDMERRLLEGEWKRTEDGELEQWGWRRISKRADGTYALHFGRAVEDEKWFGLYMERATAWLENAKRAMMDHPEMTVEELKEAIGKEMLGINF